MGQAQKRCVRAPHTPYIDRAMGLLILVPRNRIKFVKIAIRSQQRADRIFPARKRPLPSQPTGTWQKNL
jgi:hypothetical protein